MNSTRHNANLHLMKKTERFHRKNVGTIAYRYIDNYLLKNKLYIRNNVSDETTKIPHSPSCRTVNVMDFIMPQLTIRSPSQRELIRSVLPGQKILYLIGPRSRSDTVCRTTKLYSLGKRQKETIGRENPAGERQ